jgi:hypothetical protein
MTALADGRELGGTKHSENLAMVRHFAAPLSISPAHARHDGRRNNGGRA